MDKNTWIGFLIIAAIIVGFTMLNRPSKEELAERQRVQDSITFVQMAQAEAQRLSDSLAMLAQQPEEGVVAQQATAEEVHNKLVQAYGTFAGAAQGEAQWISLQNDHLRLTLSTHGGVIERAELLDYHAAGDSVNPLCLFRADESAFAVTLITANTLTDENKEAIAAADAVIVVVGTTSSYSQEDKDRASIVLPDEMEALMAE